MAMFFSYFELSAAVFMLLMAFTIISQHNDRKVARFFGRFALVAFLTAILEYSMRIAFTLELAQYINRFSSVLWSLSFAMFLHFAILFTKNDIWLKKKTILALIYLPVIAISYLFIFTNTMYSYYEIRNIGIVNQPAPMYLFFIIQGLISMAFAITIILEKAIKSNHPIYKKQLYLVSIGAIIATTIGTIFDQIIPLIYKTRLFPPTCVFDLLIMALFFYAAMRKYSLFALSPILAAETIVETMPDSLLLTNLEGRILHINNEARRFFNVSKSEILGKYLEALFKEREKFKQLQFEVVDKNLEIKRFEADLIDPNGEKIPSLINACKVRDSFGTTIGVVYIIRDICG